MTSGQSTESAKVKIRVEKWKERLVDLSRRNRLLYFRPSKSSSLQVTAPDIDEVFSSLVTAETPWSFWTPPKQEPLTANLEATEDVASLGHQEALAHKPRRKQLRCAVDDPEHLEAVLRNLYRRSRTDYEERGVRILHLTFGMLEWADNSEKVRSPLLLLPVEMRRESAREAFQIVPCEEDPVLNPALAIRLARGFKIDLPQVPEDWEETTLTGYLGRVRESVKSDWIVTPEVWMGLFSFLKVVMYRDLQEHGDLLARHPIIRGLSGEVVEKDAFGPPVPRPDSLDQTVPPRSSHLVLDADSSQLACIEACKNGSSFVLQGPPGTGKSQTICNLIAESLVQGKTVLFVSEKMAALEVVYKRLKECGLSQFILELHSHKANKKEVVQEVYRSLTNRVVPQAELTDLELEQLSRRREALNAYVSALHTKRYPFGKSVRQVLAELAQLRGIPSLGLRLQQADVLEPSTVDSLRQMASRLSRVWYIAQQAGRFPWTGNTETEYSTLLRRQYETLLNTALQSIHDLERDGLILAGDLDIKPPAEIPGARWLSDLVSKIRESPTPPESWLRFPEKLLNAAMLGTDSLAQALGDWLHEHALEDNPWSRDCRELIGLHGVLREQCDVDKTLQLDLDGLSDRFGKRYRTFFRLLIGEYRRDNGIIRAVVKRLMNYRDTVGFLKSASELRRLRERVVGALDWCLRVKRHFSNTPLSQRLVEMICSGDPLPSSAEAFAASYDQAMSTLSDLKHRFSEGWPRFGQVPFFECSFSQARDILDGLLNNLEALRDWVDYKRICGEFDKAGYHDLLSELLRRPPEAEALVRVVEKLFLESWVDGVFSKDPVLRQFRTEDHEKLIAEFKTLDEKNWKLGPYRVICEVNKRMPDPSTVYDGGELQVLQREANKMRRLLPIRKLFERIPNLLLKVKPVLLMSPLSVSQFLNPRVFCFDLVIFDEASQICAEDAAGAIYRGKQLVVCGDDKQLPPTAFFQMGMADDEYYDDSEQEDAAAEYESVLEACRGAGLPPLPLRWHYRSKHESLIAFSNNQFYGYSLITFPSCLLKGDSMGIQFEYVPDGVYDRGGRRDNPIEAERVARIVLDHFENHPGKSLGVVAFSIQQAEAIENLIEKLVRERPELERFLARDRLEGFFVKNLENVQGDERDVIVFSVGYGRDKHGNLTMNFGPLNKTGGERRLNVAITRAREKIILVSSIRAQDLRLTGDMPAGVLNLHKYLDYAERGADALEVGLTGREPDSPLEQDVASAIRELGYEVIPQVGCSGYRIDIGVLDPADPGRFILGVECDGAAYHSAATARDRDRLRQQLLEGLGWRIHRIWSPDWVNRRNTEISRLKAAISAATEARTMPAEKATRMVNLKVEKTPTTNESDEDLPEWQKPYEVACLSAKPLEDFNLPEYRQYQAILLAKIVAVEGPISIPLATRRLLRACGLHRAGSRVQSTMRRVVSLAQQNGSLVERNGYLWRPGDSEVKVVRIPVRDHPETFRSLQDIPTEEYTVAIIQVCRASMGISKVALIRNVGRVFGFARTGSDIETYIGSVIDDLVARQVLVDRNGQITVNNG